MYEQGAPGQNQTQNQVMREYQNSVWASKHEVKKAIDSGQGCQRQQAGFLNYTGDKRKAWKNVSPLLNETLVNSATQERDRDRVPNTFFISASTSKTSLQESQAPEISGKGWNKEDVPLVEQDLVLNHTRPS